MLRSAGSFALAFFAASSIAAWAQSPVFKHDNVARDGARYEAWLKKNWTTSAIPATRHRGNGYRLLNQGNDPRAASREFAQAVVTEPGNAAGWIGLSRALLAIPKGNLRGSERYKHSRKCEWRRVLGLHACD